MEPGTPDQDRGNMLISFALSTVINLAYLFIAPADQRVLLLLFFSTVVGLVALLGPKSGAYGMGLILGAAASVAIALALVGFTSLSPLS